MFKIKVNLNFTNMIGAVMCIYSIATAYDTGIWGGIILVLGRASFPALESIIRAYKGDKNNETIQ